MYIITATNIYYFYHKAKTKDNSMTDYLYRNKTPYRLGKGHTGDSSVNHTHSYHMKRVQTDRVPDTNMRLQRLMGKTCV